MSAKLPFEEVGRKNPASGVHIQLGRPNWVLLTVTTEGRHAWLANPEAHQLIRRTWFRATAWLVSDYLLMPDISIASAPRAV